MKIKQLYVYPIKSLRGVALPSIEPTYQGFKYDRRFMLLRDSDKKNMHVSQFTEMCLFTTEIVYPDAISPGKIIVTYNPPPSAESQSKQTLDVPLTPLFDHLESVPVTMHSSPVIGYDMGAEYNTWFSKCFGYDVILVYIGSNRREVLGNMSPAVAGRQVQQRTSATSSWLSTISSALPSFITGAFPGVDDGISFADCSPYLIISEKSGDNATQRLAGSGEVMDISKFRPNIIVEGAETAFEEDFWAELEIGHEFRVVLTQNCARCNSLNIDYRTGKNATGEAGKMLKKLQSDRRVDSGAKYSPIFGRYGFLDRLKEGHGWISVGDDVTVTKRNPERMKFEWPNLSTN